LVPLYFFDSRDGDDFIRDDVGCELADLAKVKFTAAKALAELALDVLPGSVKRVLKIEVRDRLRPVMEACLTFEAILLVPPSTSPRGA
jgi:hypothetical protein